MFNKKINKYVNKKRINELKCNHITENTTKGKDNDKCSNLKNAIYCILVFPIISYISFYVLCSINMDLFYLSFEYKKFSFGEKVRLSNNMYGYCILNCDSNSRKVSILYDGVFDINNDNIINTNDLISFDLKNRVVYSVNDINNIAFYVNTLNNSSFYKYRLMTSEEYVFIRNKMNFGYDWDEGNWLANDKIGSWWINSIKSNRILAVSTRGSYILYNPNEKNYLRPIIETYKSNVKYINFNK